MGKIIIQRKWLIMKLPIFFYLTIEFNSDFSSNTLLAYAALMFLILSFFISGSKITLNYYSIWAVSFLIMSYLSSFWAIDPKNVISYANVMLLRFIAIILISFLINETEDINQLLSIISNVIFWVALYLIIKVDLNAIGDMRLGTDLTGDNWNANSIALKMFWGCIIQSYRILNYNNKIPVSLTQLFNLVKILFMFFILVLCGSKQVFLLLMVALVIYISYKRRAAKTTGFILLIGLFSYGYYLIMNIDFLYNLIGIRFEQLFYAISGQSRLADSSSLLRFKFLDYGVIWFLKNPIWGYGLNNYRELIFLVINERTYSHNNFIEILTGLGLIGFSIYYLPFIYIFINLKKKNYFRISDELLKKTFMILSICLLISGIAVINYTTVDNHLIIMLVFQFISSRNLTRNNKSLNYSKLMGSLNDKK